MEPTLAEMRTYLAIDRLNLDEDLATQPELIRIVLEQCAYALSRQDKIKDDLKRLEGDIGLAIRKDMDETKTKYTEAVITAMVASDALRVAKFDELQAASLEHSEWCALRDAFTQRAYALREIGALFVAGYFADTLIKGGINSMKNVVAAERKAGLQAKREQLTPPRVRPQLNQNANS